MWSLSAVDDSYAYWAKYIPDRYVVWRLSRSCGRPGCNARFTELRPLHKRIRFLPSTRAALAEKQHISALGRFDWWFLLRASEIGSLPGEFEVVCKGQGCHQTKMVATRWTAHAKPRFVLPELKCVNCGKRTTWAPTNPLYPVIYNSKLSKLWKAFCEVPGFDITKYPRRPDIYFERGLTTSARVAGLIEAQSYLIAKERPMKWKVSHGCLSYMYPNIVAQQRRGIQEMQIKT